MGSLFPIAEWKGTMTTENTSRVVQLADDAYQAIRGINHLTLGATVPACLLYDVLGNLKGVGHLLPQTLAQLGAGLGRSLDKYDVYDGEGRDPVQSVAEAVDHLTRAAQLGQELELAQSAINMLGYHDAERDARR